MAVNGGHRLESIFHRELVVLDEMTILGIPDTR